MTRKVEEFAPRIDGKVTMYNCGPTVYDRAHIGNARSAVAVDQLFRLMRHVFGAENVTYARNFTDVDDKINARAAEEGREISDLTAETAQWYLDDMAAIGVLEPNIMPRATEYIDEMVAFIEELIAEGFAYAAEGHVLFSVKSYKDYGKFSGRSVEDMIAGARVEVAPFKRDAMDFVLWKPSDDATPGWDSPWGRGRPGWHIECSAMTRAIFGEAFDIHCGGTDLLFPHHENEVAQSCALGHDFAGLWFHNEMLQVEGKKMSKSLGNFFTVRDLLDQGIPGEVIRFVFLGTQYCKPMDWTERKRDEAEKTLRKWYASAAPGESVPQSVVNALADDLNTHGALTEMHKLSGPDLGAALSLFGLWDGTVPEWAVSSAVDLKTYADRLFDARAAAMESKDFSSVDALKAALTEAGVEVRMSKSGIELLPGPGFDAAKLEQIS